MLDLDWGGDDFVDYHWRIEQTQLCVRIPRGIAAYPEIAKAFCEMMRTQFNMPAGFWADDYGGESSSIEVPDAVPQPDLTEPIMLTRGNIRALADILDRLAGTNLGIQADIDRWIKTLGAE